MSPGPRDKGPRAVTELAAGLGWTVSTPGHLHTKTQSVNEEQQNNMKNSKFLWRTANFMNFMIEEPMSLRLLTSNMFFRVLLQLPDVLPLPELFVVQNICSRY